NIRKDFVEAGLSRSDRQYTSHEIAEEGYTEDADTWRIENEVGVAAEVVTPVMRDTKRSWENLGKALDIIKKHGSETRNGIGGLHINLSTGDYSPNDYANLVKEFLWREDAQFRLYQDPNSGQHRGLANCRPNEMPPPQGYKTLNEVRNPNKGRY